MPCSTDPRHGARIIAALAAADPGAIGGTPRCSPSARARSAGAGPWGRSRPGPAAGRRPRRDARFRVAVPGLGAGPAPPPRGVQRSLRADRGGDRRGSGRARCGGLASRVGRRVVPGRVERAGRVGKARRPRAARGFGRRVVRGADRDRRRARAARPGSAGARGSWISSGATPRRANSPSCCPTRRICTRLSSTS